MQDAVKAAGPRLAILGFLILPFVWSIPEALICAELATAFPENSGYVAWVEAAFGPFWGFLEGLFSWVSGVTDNTVYPIMFLSYLQLFIPVLSNWWVNKCEPHQSRATTACILPRQQQFVAKCSALPAFACVSLSRRCSPQGMLYCSAHPLMLHHPLLTSSREPSRGVFMPTLSSLNAMRWRACAGLLSSLRL